MAQRKVFEHFVCQINSPSLSPCSPPPVAELNLSLEKQQEILNDREKYLNESLKQCAAMRKKMDTDLKLAMKQKLKKETLLLDMRKQKLDEREEALNKAKVRLEKEHKLAMGIKQQLEEETLLLDTKKQVLDKREKALDKRAQELNQKEKRLRRKQITIGGECARDTKRFRNLVIVSQT